MLGRLRAQAAAGLDVSQHAADEMDAEEITLDEVREALATAILLEDYPTHGHGPRCLLYGHTVAGKPLHLVCTTTRPRLLLMTVYEPQPPKWMNSTQRRPRP
jgi:hypothetical protein